MHQLGLACCNLYGQFCPLPWQGRKVSRPAHSIPCPVDANAAAAASDDDDNDGGGESGGDSLSIQVRSLLDLGEQHHIT